MLTSLLVVIIGALGASTIDALIDFPNDEIPLWKRLLHNTYWGTFGIIVALVLSSS